VSGTGDDHGNLFLLFFTDTHRNITALVWFYHFFQCGIAVLSWVVQLEKLEKKIKYDWGARRSSGLPCLFDSDG